MLKKCTSITAQGFIKVTFIIFIQAMNENKVLRPMKIQKNEKLLVGLRSFAIYDSFFSDYGKNKSWYPRITTTQCYGV